MKTVCVYVCVNYGHQEWAQHSSRQRDTVFMGLRWQPCGRLLLPVNSPFLCAFHHQFLIRCYKLELGGMLPHSLQSLPHRSHDSLELFLCGYPVPDFLLWASSMQNHTSVYMYLSMTNLQRHIINASRKWNQIRKNNRKKTCVSSGDWWSLQTAWWLHT